MAVILYYLSLKIRQAFSPFQNTWGFVSLIGFVLMGLFYGWVAAAAVDGTFEGFPPDFEVVFRQALLVLVAFMTLIRNYTPSYRPLQTWFKGFHALHPWQRFLLNYSNDLVATYFFAMSGFLLAMTSLSTTLDYTFGLRMGYVLIGTHAAQRMLQTVLENKLRYTSLTRLLLAILLAVVVSSLVLLTVQENFTLLVSTTAFVALLLAGLVLEEYTWRESVRVQENAKAGRSFSTDLLLQNRSARIALLMALVFKVVFLSLDAFFYAKQGKHMYGNFAMIWLLASPAIIFTYVFNNIWGYLRHFWLLADRTATDGKELHKLLLQLIKWPLALDFTISLLYFSFSTDELFTAGMSMYVCCAFLFTAMSLYWSSARPIYIDKPVSMKANTSSVASLVLLLISSCFLLLFVSDWFYVLVPASGLLGYWMMQQLQQLYPGQRQQLFLKLFKR
ncbi:hypothetical protein [Pontibacter roseus]|uniref:hypothetical protein n=1 Tax=Pontibacter roseus TaxID=336989 RepID=UPI00037B1B5B|nr:hypothetical protein [Pontibacter roseus]